MQNVQLWTKENALSHLIDQNQYSQMQKDLQEFEKLTLLFKKFFEEVLTKQLELCNSNAQSTQALSLKLNKRQSEVEQSTQNLSDIITNIFTWIKEANIAACKNFVNYQQECNQLIDRFIRYKDDYIMTAIKLYKNDAEQFSQLSQQLTERKKQYNEAQALYEQTMIDPSLLYNQNLKIQRFQNVELKIKKIKESEQNLRTVIEIINSRRKTFCIDLIELRKIAEEIFSRIYILTQQICKKNMSLFLDNCQTWVKKSRQSKYKSTNLICILPDPNLFNFDRIGKSQLDINKLIIEQRNFSKHNKTASDQDMNQSFHSLRDDNSFNDQDTAELGLPNFLQTDLIQLNNSQLIQYQEWIKAYLKAVKENCQERNSLIILILQYFDQIGNSLRKQGRPCIPLQDLKSDQQPATLLKWYQSFSAHFGGLGIETLNTYIQFNDLFNLYCMQLSIYMKTKSESLTQIQQQLIQQQNITMSSIDKQIEDLNKLQQEFVKASGLVVKNRTVALNTMDSASISHREQKEAEIRFRQIIQISQKAISHLILELNKQSSKLIRTVLDILESTSNQLNIQLRDLTYFQISGFQEQQLTKICKLNALQFLQSKATFSIFYKAIKDQPFLESVMTSDFDIELEEASQHNEFLQITTPKRETTEESRDMDILSQNSTSQDEQEMNFIKEKIKTEPQETFIHSFACALSEKIQLQGRLYITDKRLFFHSNFNSSNIFFGDTILNIPKIDILQIQKKTNAYIFDNSIAILTPKGQIFFATFFSRDQAYNLIIKQFEPKEQPELKIQSDESPNLNAIKMVVLNYSMDEQNQLNERANRILALAGPNPQIKVNETIFSFPNLDVRLFYKLIFSDIGHNQSYTTYERMKFTMGISNTTISKWLPPVPIEFDPEFGQQGLLNSEVHVRNFACTQPLPKSSIPFMPKECRCEEEAKIYFISPIKFLMELKVVTLKAPYSESFYVTVRYLCEQVPEGVKLTTFVENVFHKSVMVQKIIEAASVSEITMKTKEMMMPFMKKEIQTYFNMLNNIQPEDTEIMSEPVQVDNKKQWYKSLNFSFCKQLLQVLIFAVLCFSIYHFILSKVSIKFDYIE